MLKWLALGFALFIVAVIVLADEGLLGPLRGLYDFPHGDKAGHFVLYGLLALFVNLYALSRQHANPKVVVWAVSVGLAILIGVEEWSQARFPTRTMDALDLLAGYAGVALFSFAAYLLKKTAAWNR